jgi:hypothetical protein
LRPLPPKQDMANAANDLVYSRVRPFGQYLRAHLATRRRYATITFEIELHGDKRRLKRRF